MTIIKLNTYVVNGNIINLLPLHVYQKISNEDNAFVRNSPHLNLYLSNNACRSEKCHPLKHLSVKKIISFKIYLSFTLLFFCGVSLF